MTYCISRAPGDFEYDSEYDKVGIGGILDEGGHWRHKAETPMTLWRSCSAGVRDQADEHCADPREGLGMSQDSCHLPALATSVRNPRKPAGPGRQPARGPVPRATPHGPSAAGVRR